MSKHLLARGTTDNSGRMEESFREQNNGTLDTEHYTLHKVSLGTRDPGRTISWLVTPAYGKLV